MIADDLVYRLRKRAEIRKQITTRKSVQNNEPDRIADLLEEAADEIAKLRMENAGGFEAGRQLGMQQERALWKLAASTQEIDNG
jgi:hypothetical protein